MATLNIVMVEPEIPQNTGNVDVYKRQSYLYGVPPFPPLGTCTMVRGFYQIVSVMEHF